MKLTEQDYKYIQENEMEFSHALNESYFRIVNRNMLKEYAMIFKRVFGRDSKILNGCNRCVLQDIKLLAQIYFQDKKEYVEPKTIEQVVENVQPQKTTTKTNNNKTKKTKK